MFCKNKIIEWEVEKKKLFLENGQEVQNATAVVRNDTFDVLNVITTGEKYKLLTNKNFLEITNEIKNITKLNLLTFNEIDGGNIIYSVMENDMKRIIIYTSHNGTLSTTLYQFPIIRINSKVINLNVNQSKEKIKHTLNCNFYNIISFLNKSDAKLNEINFELNSLKEIKISSIEELYSNIFNKINKTSRMREKIKQCSNILRANGDFTYYGAIASICEYIDCYRTYRSNDTKIKSIFFGGNSEKMKYEMYKYMREK